MKKGLTRAGIGNVGDLESFVKIAHRYGFEAVDAGGDELAQLIDKHGGAEGARAFLNELGVSIGSIGLPAEWRQSEEKFLQGIPKLVQAAEAASAVGCTSCCTWVLPTTDATPAEYIFPATRRLKLCAQILDAYGLRLGLEYVGPHHLRSQSKYPFVWDQQGMLEWIGVIDEPNVGLLLDTLHWHTTGSDPEELLQLRPEQVVHAHINDAPSVPVEQVLDNGRLYPGEGAIDIATFLKALKTIGYTGAVAQEILTQAPVQGTPDELVKRSADAFAKVFAAAGL